MQKVAFFDIDGTVFRSSLLIELVDAFVLKGIFPEEALTYYVDMRSEWANREGSYEKYIEGVIAAFMKYLPGMHYRTLAEVGKEVVDQQSKRVYRYTRDLIQDLKSKDYFIVAISQSPKTVLDDFCGAYGFDKVYGRIYEIGPRDLFTGAVAEESVIKDKALVIERVIHKHNLTLDGSVGVGDTEGDIGLLSKVDTPICFNPNMKLYQHAQANNWAVVVERKDVIYTI